MKTTFDYIRLQVTQPINYIRFQVIPPVSFGLFLTIEGIVLYGLYRAIVTP